MAVVDIFEQNVHEFAIKTPRLTLRVARRADMAGWINARTLSYNTLQPWEPTWPHDSLTASGFMSYYEFSRQQYTDKKMLLLLVIDNQTQQVIGGCEAVRFMDWPVQSAMTGYWMSASVRGQGYMPEALHGLCHTLYKVGELRRVEAAILPHNQASRRVLEKLGFAHEGNLREFAEINGQWCDHQLYSLLLHQMPAAALPVHSVGNIAHDLVTHLRNEQQGATA